VALDKKEVADKFRELGVVAVKADWTRFDARITRALAGLGKNSIPVYVIYSGENHRNMKILPEIITPATVMEALETVK
jgi:thiol:disulfide interchange protein DsbD